MYENKEWVYGYREVDNLDGYDPYSNSKSCSELVTHSYKKAFFDVHKLPLSTARAGNVIGGGDWAKDRLITDLMVSTSQGKKISIRNPKATRPWQHVLECISGYLHIGQKLLEELVEYSGAWNFGPSYNESICVEEVIKRIKKYWNKIDYEIRQDLGQPHEANLLKLDCSKAYALLKWKDVWDSETTLEKTAKWYKAYYENNGEILTQSDLENYIRDARMSEIEWAI